MKSISIYVHDLFWEIGHSNVTLDMLNNLPNTERYEVNFIVYSHDTLENLKLASNINARFHKVPLPKLRPIFLKIVFYQIYVLLYSLIYDKADKKISLGISNMNADTCIVHFIHKQWSEKYFHTLKMNFFKKIYKKIFFTYLNGCEWIFFKRKKLKIITVSNFMEKFLTINFNIERDRIKTIYTAFNPNRFKPQEIEKEELKRQYPNLKNFNFEKPTHLFVGAFERKGLDSILPLIKNHTQQFIIIGQPEGNKKYNFQHFSNVFYIKYTKDIQSFYQVADHFIFPTIYEPFGMVILEAFMMGLDISCTKGFVGASEILEEADGIQFLSHPVNHIKSLSVKISNEERLSRHSKRQKKLENLTWKQQSKKYYDFLFTKL